MNEGHRPGRRDLTAGQANSLDVDGYVVVPDVLDAAWLERLRRAFVDAPAQRDGTQHVTLTADTPELEAWDALKQHPVVLAAASQVMEDAPFSVRDLHGRNPRPGFGQQGLHADWVPRAEVKPFFVVTALWMIDEFTTENGATRIVPGTHLMTRPIPKELAQPAATHPSERYVTGAAGSVVVLNGHTWHSGRMNKSGGERRAAQMVLQRQPPGG